MKRFFTGAALMLAALALHPSASYAWKIDYSDTYLSIRYLPEDKQPGNQKDVNEVAGNIAYANGWTYGSNFVSLDFEDFGKGDLSNSVTGHANSNSFELYSVFRTVLSGNKIFGGGFAFGPIRDVGLELGLDIDTQNDQFASYKKLITVGPQFSINLPKGFLNITIGLSHEWDTNAYLSNGNGTNFNSTYTIETAWAYPFAVGPIPLNFTGFANLIGPKGKGATGDFYHKLEILVHPKLMVDVGDLIGFAPRKLEAGVGFEYWHNKFGDRGPYVVGTEQRSVFVEAGYHF
jgi:hypothetical protein